MTASPPHILCAYCTHVIPYTHGKVLTCERCGHRDSRTKAKSARLTLVFSLTALIFYFPANIFPFMTVELYGNRSSSTIIGGIISLADSGSMAIATLVFLASVLIPIIKLIILFYLSLTARTHTHQAFKTRLYHFVETIGRWSMLDIFLLAVLVAILKLGHFATVKPEIGSVIFALVVIFTMLASAFFDPKLIWDEDYETTTPST